jgi:hypothetical protein
MKERHRNPLINRIARTVREPAGVTGHAIALEMPVRVLHEDAVHETQVDVLELRPDPREEHLAPRDREVVADQPPPRTDTLHRFRKRAPNDRPESLGELGDRVGILRKQAVGRDDVRS